MNAFACPRCRGVMTDAGYRVGPLRVPGLRRIVCEQCGFAVGSVDKWVVGGVGILLAVVIVALVFISLLVGLVLLLPVVVYAVVRFWLWKRRLKKLARGDQAEIIDVTVTDAHDEPPASLP